MCLIHHSGLQLYLAKSQLRVLVSGLHLYVHSSSSSQSLLQELEEIGLPDHHPRCVGSHWCTGNVEQRASADTFHLLAASLDFRLHAKVQPRVDGWPRSGADCTVVSYTKETPVTC